MVISLSDSGTYPLMIARIMLSSLCVSPLQQGAGWRFLSLFLFVNVACMLSAHMTFMFQHATDLALMGSSCTTVSASIQTTSKIAVLNWYKKDLADIWHTIDTEFWPADITDKATQLSIRQGSRIITIMLCVYLSSAFVSATDYMAIHLVYGRRILPLESTFPFSWNVTPRFELITIWQFILHIYVVIQIIATHDFFFNALVSNCIAQFKLLQTSLLTIGTNKALTINQRLNKLAAINNGYPKLNDLNQQYDLVAKCVEHHNRVIKVCKKIQHVYGGIILLQFFLSALALCVSTFVLTNFDNYLTKMASFAIAHLIQFFFLCAIASNLISQSVNVASAGYCSKWYNLKEGRVTQALVLLIQRAQRQVKITALGFANLDYPSFINVLRFSFSVYTLLSSFQQK